MFDIEQELKKLPDHPGVYLMHDKDDAIIYIGKAISLKKRVRQYFQRSTNKGAKIEKMVENIARFEYILTDSELEALVLECNLIKEHRPKYNTMLKDDKSYPYIKVTLGEEFPRVMFSRRMKKDKSKYFGPYTSSDAVRETIELLDKAYMLRTCNKKLPKDIAKDRPCLNYHIERCLAPCQGYISSEDYRKRIDAAVAFLNGDYKSLLDELEEKMYSASDKLDYEKAGEYKEQINALKQIAQKQKMLTFGGEDRDYIALAKDVAQAVVQVFFVRDGRLIGREHFFMNIPIGEQIGEILKSFAKQFYSGTPYIPSEIIFQEPFDEAKLLGEMLSNKKGKKVTITFPKKGTKEKFIVLAAQNARMVLDRDIERIKREEERTTGALRQIEEILGMSNLNRIEAYDISNTSGYESVGSMVVYEKGRPSRGQYRKFKIKTVTGPDDYASMYEVLSRRFKRGKKMREEMQNNNSEIMSGFAAFPDIILMDGGRGQVNIALKVLDELGLNIPVCGMVKDDRHRTRGLYFDNKELPIDTHSEGFMLITRIQDEAHRFAIEYHRSLRSKGQVHSILDDIDGIGPKRRRALMKTFMGLEGIRTADVGTLSKVESMDMPSAQAVYDFFHKDAKGDLDNESG